MSPRLYRTLARCSRARDPVRAIENVFHVAEPRPRAALSYVVDAFRVDPDAPAYRGRSNLWEARTIGRLLHDLGYIVDVIDCLDPSFVPARRYALYLDVGINLRRLRGLLPSDCLTVYYATGRHWLVQNLAELVRLDALRMRAGIELEPRRQVPAHESVNEVSALIVLGNECVAQTFGPSATATYLVPQSVAPFFLESVERDWHDARRTFLWLGSAGMVHKGLDIVLDVFARRADLVLHIVGPAEVESDFAAAYGGPLRARNVHLHGFMDLGTNSFLDIARRCGVLVYPSCSEAVSGSVLVSMGLGLIPIVSLGTCADVGSAGIVLAADDADHLESAIDSLVQAPVDVLIQRSDEARRLVSHRQTRRAFEESMAAALRSIVATHPVPAEPASPRGFP